MRRILPTTLFGQLLLGTVLAQTVLLGVFVAYLVISQRHLSESRTRQRMAEQLERLAVSCSNQLQHGDTRGLRDVLELSRIAPTIDVARVTDLAGKTLTVTDNGRTRDLDTDERRLLAGTVHQEVFSERNGQLEAVAPLPVGTKPVALLWLEPNRALPRNALQTILRICLTYGVFALLANIIPIFLIVRTITKPLQRLRGATQHVIHYRGLEAEFPLPVTTGNEAGDLTASFNIMVAEIAKQREGLLETVALLDSMLGNAPTGFAFFDQDLRYVKLNQCLADLFGSVSVEEHLGHRASEAQPGLMTDTIEDQLKQVFETGRSIRNVEVTAPAPNQLDGQRHWLLHFYPVRLQGGSVRWAGVIVVDITERLQAEEALRRTEKLAAAGRLAASIAHEINNPLESVTNLLYLLETHDSLDPIASKFVQTAQAELARVSEITQQTLRFYRQSTSPTLTDVSETLDSIVSLYQPRLHSGHIQVVRKFVGRPEAFAFSGELRQVFANLVGNAIDSMPDGGCLFVRARRGSGKNAGGQWCRGVRITVADTGTGMSKDTLQRIFEAFFTTKQVTGTGLGLWVSDEIIRKHNGTFGVRSRQIAQSGTVFSVFLPVDVNLRQAPGQPGERLHSRRVPGSLAE